MAAREFSTRLNQSLVLNFVLKFKLISGKVKLTISLLKCIDSIEQNYLTKREYYKNTVIDKINYNAKVFGHYCAGKKYRV